MEYSTPKMFNPSEEETNKAFERMLKKSTPMNYEIKETHVIWNSKGIQEIAVLWADNNDLRATYMTTEPTAGHGSIKPTDALTIDLLQKIAGYGVYLDTKRKNKYFKHVKNWSK